MSEKEEDIGEIGKLEYNTWKQSRCVKALLKEIERSLKEMEQKILDTVINNDIDKNSQFLNMLKGQYHSLNHYFIDTIEKDLMFRHNIHIKKDNEDRKNS
jgi:hypothetical protein